MLYTDYERLEAEIASESRRFRIVERSLSFLGMCGNIPVASVSISPYVMTESAFEACQVLTHGI